MTSTSIYQEIPVIQSKTCDTCTSIKSINEFYKCKSNKDGLQNKCKLCDKEYKIENKEHNTIRVKAYNEINSEHHKEYNKEYRKINSVKLKEQARIWQKDNRGTINAVAAKRRAAKLKAIPKWAELDLIDKLYDACKALSQQTEIEHNVDHIVPLRSEIVCGLHCMANLQILTATENKSKKNYYWPDMP